MPGSVFCILNSKKRHPKAFLRQQKQVTGGSKRDRETKKFEISEHVFLLTFAVSSLGALPRPSLSHTRSQICNKKASVLCSIAPSKEVFMVKGVEEGM